MSGIHVFDSALGLRLQRSSSEYDTAPHVESLRRWRACVRNQRVMVCCNRSDVQSAGTKYTLWSVAFARRVSMDVKVCVPVPHESSHGLGSYEVQLMRWR